MADRRNGRRLDGLSQGAYSFKTKGDFSRVSKVTIELIIFI